MPIQKIKSGRVITVDANTFVGDKGTIFYDEDAPQLRLSNGITPGGLLIGGSSSGLGDTFETVNKNLKSYPASFSYQNSKLVSVVYSIPGGTIVKTLNYSNDLLSSIVLSGLTPGGISLTKTLNYSNGRLSSITYS